MIEHHAPGTTGQAIIEEGEVIDHWLWKEASTPESCIDSLEILSWICFMADITLIGIS